METFIAYITRNYIAFIAAVLFVGAYLFFSFQGNRICDCEKTEKYSSATTRTGGVNRFYHK